MQAWKALRIGLMDPLFSTEIYNYELPEELIAQKPLGTRSESRLLHFNEGKIDHLHFSDITEILPSKASLFFNNAKVIPARTFFRRDSGAEIEIFLLNPSQGADIQKVLEQKTACTWECLIRNLKKWKDGELISCKVLIGDREETVFAELLNRESMEVTFTHDGKYSFSELLEALGKIPLPPYIKRASNESDRDNYQTVYADNEGAVAAPTAGLHFTEEVQKAISERGIGQHYMTLHVGAGTFKPVSSDRIDEHEMHKEDFECPVATLEALLNSPLRIAVGTTSLRTMESLYWIGVKLMTGKKEPFMVEQNVMTLNQGVKPSYEEAIQEIIHYAHLEGLEAIKASTSIMIYPGYKIRSIEGLITNFHLPKSTLIMLVSAFIGEDWREVYRTAVDEGYRFLSYGDSSLLLNSQLKSPLS